ncbi:MAG: DUF4012 domain-containing protein [Patescibacteria group bacterium]|nr:DUF4012 domain-containing protein [Patescibacteria group bacterium]
MHQPTPQPRKTMRDVHKPLPRKRYAPELKRAEAAREHERVLHRKPNTPTRIQPVTIGIAAGVSFIFFSLFFFAHNALAIIARIKAQLPGLKTAATTLNTGNLSTELQSLSADFTALDRQAHAPGISLLTGIANAFIPGAGMLPDAVAQGAALNQKAADISKDVDFLKNNALGLATSGHGDELVAAVTRIDNNVSSAKLIADNLAAEASGIALSNGPLASAAKLVSQEYNRIEPDFAAASSGIAGLRTLLTAPGDQHILVLFQNPTEIRPAGGFLGSYGDVVLNQGNITAINVDDIYNADRQLDLKIAPPEQLSGITPTWGARDANWFFDFPTSAKKVASLLQDSNLYQPTHIFFSAVVGINTNVLQSILGITGPIDLPDYNLTITEQNFLPELQHEVELGPDKKPGQNPKKILSVLMPLLMQKLHTLTADQKSQLVATLADHVKTKDIMAYASDSRLQEFLNTADVAGSVYALPDDFTGDYLAVVNANVAGGKTDALINQHVALTSTIDADGNVIDQLAVTRDFQDTNQTDWYYLVPNKDFITILTPPGSKLLALTGNDAARTPVPPAPELSIDPDLARIESSETLNRPMQTLVGSEWNKISFGAWLTTDPQKTRTLTVQYQSGNPLPIHDGMTYTFVFEKQSGVDGSLEYTLIAPPGYQWKESGSPTFTYDTEQLAARETVTATLVKQ